MRIYLLAIAILIGISAEAQVIRAEPFYTAPEEAAVVTNLLLDSFPGAAVAYSLRKLDKDYTGSAIRVRRSSDNTEQDIGFVNNYLDTASMKTFVGANNGFVVTWYNQSDSSGVFGVRNATQSFANLQPTIISAGVVNRNDSEPSLFFSTDELSSPNYTVSSGTTSCYIAIARNTASENERLIRTGSGSNQRNLTYGLSSSQIVNIFNGTVGLSTASLGSAAERLIFARHKLNDAAIFVNGSSQATSATWLNPSATSLSFGVDGVNYYDGHMKEMIIYNDDQSSNRTAIESNINSFYSIY